MGVSCTKKCDGRVQNSGNETKENSLEEDCGEAKTAAKAAAKTEVALL
jgi:hypothetical protein